MTWKTRTAAVVGIILGGFAFATASSASPPMPSSLATATPFGGAAYGTGFGEPGQVALSESGATATDGGNQAFWNAIDVNGTTVLGRDANDNWTGPLAPAGKVIDTVNAHTCPGELPVPSVQGIVCVEVLSSGDYVGHGAGAFGSLAYASAFVVTPAGPLGVETRVVNSEADATGCQAESRASLLTLSYLTPVRAGDQTVAPSTSRANGCG